MFPAPIRIIFFIFVFFICIFSHFIAIILIIFYTIKGGYSFYLNTMTDHPNPNLMPTIFSLLPISTYKPETQIGSFLLYPFRYPKSDSNLNILPNIMKTYYNDLIDSFQNFNKIKNIPLFDKNIKKIENNFEHLHDQSLTIFPSKSPKNIEPTNKDNISPLKE
jgi:hypothetical protein